MNKIIELHNIQKVYKRGTENVHAVNGINLDVERGEFLSLVGPSGSGKTTLLNLIGCVDIPTSGSIRLDGLATEHLKERELTAIRAATIGFVFQQFFLLPTLTALENVELPTIFNRKAGSSVLKSRAKELLHMVGLSNRENHLPSHLSGGEMQRVAIARALINDPKVLLADEPTGNLDSKNADAIMGIFGALNHEGLTVILVTHSSEIAVKAQRRVLLKDGEIHLEPM